MYGRPLTEINSYEGWYGGAPFIRIYTDSGSTTYSSVRCANGGIDCLKDIVYELVISRRGNSINTNTYINGSLIMSVNRTISPSVKLGVFHVFSSSGDSKYRGLNGEYQSTTVYDILLNKII